MINFGSRTVFEVFHKEIFNETLQNSLDLIEHDFTHFPEDYTDDNLQTLLLKCTEFFNALFEHIFEHFKTEFIIDTEEELRNKTRNYFNMWKAAFAFIFNDYPFIKKILNLSNSSEKRNIISSEWYNSFSRNIIINYIGYGNDLQVKKIYSVIIDELIKIDNYVEKLLEFLNQKYGKELQEKIIPPSA